MRYLHGVHERNACGAEPVLCVRPSVHMFQLENRWTDFDEIWYVRSAIGG
jgi:hypothetical protein